MNRYTINKSKVIGIGGYSKIYEVITNTDFKTDEELVVKTINDSYNGIQSPLELLIMKSYRNNLIVNCLDIQKEKDSINIFIKKYKGSLFDIYLNLNREEVLRIFNTLCQALYSLHKENIIHADIKLENILYDDELNVVITDFSLSRYENNLTNVPVCTVKYRPPEGYLNLPITTKVDVWSLGCLLYKLLYKVYLFPNQYKDEDKKINNPEEVKKINIKIDNCSINCINDWCERFYNLKININTNSCDYKKMNLRKDFLNDDFILNLLKGMLHPISNKRYNIETILKILDDNFQKSIFIRPNKLRLDINNDENNKFQQNIRYYSRLLELSITNSPSYLKVCKRIITTIPDSIAVENDKIILSMFITDKICAIVRNNYYQDINKLKNKEFEYYTYINFKLI